MRYSLIILTSLLASLYFFVRGNNDIPNRLDENIPVYLDSISPDIKKFTEKSDTIYDIAYHKDGHFSHIIGKIIDEQNVYALLYDDKDTLLNFYYFDLAKTKWKQIGSERPVWEQIFDVSIEDMDGDNRNEVITFSYPNMNGNTFKEIYYFSPNNDSVHIAASFFTSTYEADKIAKTVRTYYGGSWYMPLILTLYKWHGENLIIMKEIRKNLVEDAPMGSDHYILSYYENPLKGDEHVVDSLSLIFEFPFEKAKHQYLWDNFFEEN
ncbi:hypothetical protein JGH11_06055 [Dysgonomonas sp. Marseille-P4677]|uniref:hypothetical protein n=1 Tax=Dysgonomonas sp. Marseille-P4677 TaxID=2364790 RepID=UPI001911D4C4|nr:hypothetical protein [Dysgonomonas sp. Marseille-P4677]MBK5720429.1 hypothetical protein [Dysgonomonas sp. Marseille-P4677]